MQTPLYKIKVDYLGKKLDIYVKDESFNVSGSIKIRPAKYIIKKAYELDLLKKDQEVIEVTSGNMGIALAEALKPYGNKLTIYMPKSMSKERQDKLKAYGVNLVLTDNFKEAFKLAESNQNCFYIKQFENRFNAESYAELVKEVEDKINVFPAFIAGVGTGGTLNGVGHVLKNKYQSKVIAIDPKESMLLMTGVNHGEHQIEGLSDGFIPSLYPKEIVDYIIPISSEDAIRMSQRLRDELHLKVGISSGANFLGAVLSNINNILTVFPDSIDRYYSTNLSNNNIKSNLVDSIKIISLELI